MADDGRTADVKNLLQQIQAEDVIGQLRRGDGLMARLGSENGSLKLDWVEGIDRLLADTTQIENVEREAYALWQQGIRHIIWAGMGGSIITVRVLKTLGFCDSSSEQGITIYPLDSTDPAALNTIIRQIAHTKNLSLPASPNTVDSQWLKSLLADVMMVGVAMGMTSEEPITHLRWFTELLQQAQLRPADHLLVMTIPDSFLDRFAHEQKAPSRPLQLDGGNGTGGRMSAPTTRVFLLPAALYLLSLKPDNPVPGQLRRVLKQAWLLYDLDQAYKQPANHPFVQLAATLSAVSHTGTTRMLLNFPAPWQSMLLWIEQLLEESLGKGGKGIVAFPIQHLHIQSNGYKKTNLLYVDVAADKQIQPSEPLVQRFILSQPYLAATNPVERLAAVAASFLGWQLAMALYGYLQHITFAGQPAVENYKARARKLRDLDDPLTAISNWTATYQEGPLTLYAPYSVEAEKRPAMIFVALLKQAQVAHKDGIGYLDFTINGELSDEQKTALAESLYHLSNNLLGVPLKFRQAPADYHSTEQSEMDGPENLVSLRLLLQHHETCLAGHYTDGFLRAQAVSTWQAMLEQGRSCSLLLVENSSEETIEPVLRFLQEVIQLLTDSAIEK